MSENNYNFSSREPSLISRAVLDEGYRKMYGEDFYSSYEKVILQVKDILIIILDKFRNRR